MHSYHVRIELDALFGPEDVALDLQTNPLHPLHAQPLQIIPTAASGIALALTIAAADLWTAILTAMALLRQSGYIPASVHATASLDDPPLP